MNTKEYLSILVEEINSVVVATVDDNGLPSTRVIDIMLYDESGIYFLTAKGKSFYAQLMARPYISLSGITGGGDTMSRKSVTLSGTVKNIGSTKLEEIFAANPYMAEIYSSIESRDALEVFHLYKGQGNYFDLSTKPITRGNFVVGDAELKEFGYVITETCNGCGLCVEHCPQNCIREGSTYVIDLEHCLNCGNCYNVCPQDSVIKHGGF